MVLTLWSVLQVRALFQESPFLSAEDSVSIMDGTDEGNMVHMKPTGLWFCYTTKPSRKFWTFPVSVIHLHGNASPTVSIPIATGGSRCSQLRTGSEPEEKVLRNQAVTGGSGDSGRFTY